ncbi:hypothetical protein A359_00700 [secondary endosymbiont of Ctenarytaina eucalypti]|uniref:Uncharacterized protein n=1 Tax=secondary endosymbiont of Ctenarytaina eucalypti TaxID=1199245 RepID=J3TWU0_9ENTR|nr:hypothetical protein A359_00700 [secondary endosymbiont of Ctenarytaina eucalypti]
MIRLNCSGMTTLGEYIIGIMPGYIHPSNRVGIVAYFGTLTYEAVKKTTETGLGQPIFLIRISDLMMDSSCIDILQFF